MTTEVRDGAGAVIYSDAQPTVHEAVARVLAELPAIPKGGEAPASMGGYAFRRVEDITAALKPLFAKHGVLCIPSVMGRIETQRTTGNNKILYCVDLEIRFRFIGPQGDELAANVWGQGTDSGDKATQKAVTSAFKTMLSVVFCISDSELDAEAHDVPETHRAPAATPADPEWVERVNATKDTVVELNLGQWVKDQGFTWPWSPEVCDTIDAKVGFVRAALDAPEDPPAAPAAPASPATPPEAADPASPPCATDAAEEATQHPLVAHVAPEPGDGDWIDPAVLVAQQVEAMPSSAVFAELEAAGLATTGAPKALKKRLTAHRILAEGAQQSEVY